MARGFKISKMGALLTMLVLATASTIYTTQSMRVQLTDLKEDLRMKTARLETADLALRLILAEPVNIFGEYGDLRWLVSTPETHYSIDGVALGYYLGKDKAGEACFLLVSPDYTAGCQDISALHVGWNTPDYLTNVDFGSLVIGAPYSLKADPVSESRIILKYTGPIT